MALPIEVPKICGLKNPFKKICLCLCQYMYCQTFQKYNMLVPCCNILRGLEIYLQITLQWVAFGRLCKTGGEGTLHFSVLFAATNQTEKPSVAGRPICPTTILQMRD